MAEALGGSVREDDRLSFGELASAIARGEVPAGVEILKRNPVRCVARIDDALLKVALTASRAPAREARALLRAARQGLRVPALLDVGESWLAVRFVAARPARREDLGRILPAVQRMHTAGMLHGDLHLGNILIDGEEPVWLDLQRARFLPFIPELLRRRELGFLAFSLGDPPPQELARTRFWRELRAQRHWRSRTRRCVKESSRFTRFEFQGKRGFRMREIDPSALGKALEDCAQAQPLKQGRAGRLYRSGSWILKEHRRARFARRAWIAARGLEVRGIPTARAIAQVGRWLVMEDAGETLIDWVERDFADSAASVHEQLAERLAELLASLHRRGIYHADLKANNIAWSAANGARLLDYARVGFGLRVSRRRRVKNLAQLNAALPDLVPARLRRLALQRYTEQLGRSGELESLSSEVVALSLKRKHRWSGC